MKYKIIAEFHLRNGKTKEFLEWCKYIVGKTREAESCLNIEVVIDQNDHKHAFIFQEWDNFQNYKDSFSRLENLGAWRSIKDLTQRNPTITFCNFLKFKESL